LTLALHIAATACVLYFLLIRGASVYLDAHDGEHIRHWGPQAAALLFFLIVVLGAIWS
jgi:hypothetical protein